MRIPLVTVSAAAALLAPATRADILTGVGLNFNESFTQNSNTAPGSPFGYFFDANAQYTVVSPSFTSASVTIPGGGSQPMSVRSPGELDYQTPYLTSLNAYPAGTYIISATNTNGTQSANISYGERRTTRAQFLP